jgi:hypothetical protein
MNHSFTDPWVASKQNLDPEAEPPSLSVICELSITHKFRLLGVERRDAIANRWFLNGLAGHEMFGAVLSGAR